ncbi:MAG: M23 family metallopeptidase [Candidatus Lambdaproteobacteria bacterium]|nr:M23 family metallopeptidase [Candidatus Lambdaproteobacteria bacterium]
MRNDWYTVVVVPDRAPRVMRFKLPKGLLALALIACAALVVLSGYGVLRTLGLNKDLSHYRRIETERLEQQIAVRRTANSIEGFRDQMTRLRELDYNLRIITDRGVRRPSPSIYGIGGSVDPRSAGLPERKAALAQPELALLDKELTGLEEMANYQEESFNELKAYLSTQKDLIRRTPHRWPVRGFISSGFGRRLDPFTGLMVPHEGLDIVAPRGTMVRAPADGIVTYAGMDPTLGHMLVIDHGNGIITRYGHNESLLVREGMRLKRGDPITLVGSSGQSTGPHLHYEIRIDDAAIDPHRFMID